MYDAKYDSALRAPQNENPELARGLALLETLRPLLPASKLAGLEKAKRLLIGAAGLCEQMQSVSLHDTTHTRICDLIFCLNPADSEHILQLYQALEEFSALYGHH